MKKWLTLDVGGTFIKYAWVQEHGEIINQGKVATPYEGQEAFFSLIESLWKQETESAGLAISLPGTIDTNTGYVYQGGSLSYNHQTNLKTLLEARLSTQVELENDARCAALAEQWMGNMQGIANGIILTFGTGVGGCFILNHEIYKGTHFFSGEVSMLICKEISTYGMGAVLGNIASIPGFVKKVCEAKGVEEADGKQVFTWITEQDPIALPLFQAYCQQVVTQLFNLQLILDPQRVCIGGGVSSNPIFMNGLCSAMDAFYDRLPLQLPRLEIVPCKFHNDANLLGAFHHFQKMREQRSNGNN